ncbi:MAG: pyrroline-5-carboxylate reductase [Oscillospiraceae bacterium]|jgi:pyrroline-5-carboxylate reductase|nr:pyrroline-5-carboxylate reductase [Oscillospiraceae bacterium]
MYGFLGAGNMGGAILRGAAAKFGAERFSVYDLNSAVSENLAVELGVKSVQNSSTLAENSKFVILCVKPQTYKSLLSEIAPALKSKVLVSIMAGVPISDLRAAVGEDVEIVRVMPNLPAMVGSGCTEIASDSPASAASLEAVRELFSSVGEVLLLPEKQLDAATASASCSPAFAFIFVEALADAGVSAGLARADAVKMAAAALGGAAKMVLAGEDPAVLKNRVTSPGGSTIRGVAKLEELAFRGAIMAAYEASYERNKALGK